MRAKLMLGSTWAAATKVAGREANALGARGRRGADEDVSCASSRPARRRHKVLHTKSRRLRPHSAVAAAPALGARHLPLGCPRSRPSIQAGARASGRNGMEVCLNVAFERVLFSRSNLYLFSAPHTHK